MLISINYSNGLDVLKQYRAIFQSPSTFCTTKSSAFAYYDVFLRALTFCVPAEVVLAKP